MPSAHPAFEDSPDYVQSLARGLEVLRAFDQEHPAMTLSEVAERTDLARAAARRCLLTLEHLGYVASRGRQFSLTPRVLDLGFAYLSSLDLAEAALPIMERLAQRLQESCSMSVLDGQDIVYVARVPVRRVMTIALGVGARLPAFATSMGRVLVAGLPEEARKAWVAKVAFKPLTPLTVRTKSALEAELRRVRDQGYALVQQELESGLCSLAVPIRDRRQRPAAALNVGMQNRPGIKDHALKTVLPALKEAQQSIERAMIHHWAGTGF